MLLRRLYVMILNSESGRLGLYLPTRNDNQESLIDLSVYADGYMSSEKDRIEQPEADDWFDFLDWLTKNNYHNSAGWAATIVQETGDGAPALQKFRELLFEYLELNMPNWFVDFNSVEQPSEWFRLLTPGEEDKPSDTWTSMPRKADVRIEKHIQLVAAAQ